MIFASCNSNILLQYILHNKKIYLAFCINILFNVQLKSNVYIHLAESAKCWLFYQVRGIIQKACYCSFSTDLNNIFYIKDVYM